VIVWMAVIFFFSAQPNSGDQSSALLLYLGGWLGLDASWPYAETVHHLCRKAAHFTEYALLGALCGWALPNGGQRWLVAWACATGYAATDELHQAFVPGRGPAVLDVLIDALGAAAACAIAARVWSFADTALAAEDAASR
jgi:VanZ family protein